MELVVRAYDHRQVLKAETLPVQRLWEVLQGSGLRTTQERSVLAASVDAWARETVVARLEDLLQEGYGRDSLARLRGAGPATLVDLRRKHWPPIARDEAVALREDLVRYLTYGLWHAPEETVAHALAELTGRADATFLIGDSGATADVREVISLVGQTQPFAERFGPGITQAVGAGDGAEGQLLVAQELQRVQDLLLPAAALINSAREAGLRVLVYQEDAHGDGLTALLDRELAAEDALPSSRA